MSPRSQLYPWTIGNGYLRHISWAERQFDTAKNCRGFTFDEDDRDSDGDCLVRAVMNKESMQVLRHITVTLETHQ